MKKVQLSMRDLRLTCIFEKDIWKDNVETMATINAHLLLVCGFAFFHSYPCLYS